MRQGLLVLAALALGVALGAWIKADAPYLAQTALQVSVLGSIWLDSLKMTLLPLIFAVLVAAIEGMAETAAAGRLARRALLLFSVLLVLVAVYSILTTGFVLDRWPIPADVGARILANVPGAGADAPSAAPVDFAAWARSLIPTNIVAAAAQDQILSVVVFACIFGFAVSRLAADRRAPVANFFKGVGEAMIVVVQWVLALAPIGVFGLSLSLGLNTGLDALGLLAQYVAIVSSVTIGITLIAMVVVPLAAAMPPTRWLGGLAPIQVIAASTQSSVASLPAMLQAAKGPLRVSTYTAEFVLPLAVAVFRYTSPVANLAVVVFLTRLHHVEPSLAQWGAAVLVAFAVSVSSVGLPGQTSFFAAVAPICLTVGVPLTLLPVLLAVEPIPDIFRTIGNVTGDLGAAAILDRFEKRKPPK